MPSASGRSASSRPAFPGTPPPSPDDCAPFPRILRENGYSTAAFGKWHLTPDGQQGAAGPFDRWPDGWGFDYFYGFLGGGSGQWDPCLAENQKIIGTPPEYYDEENPYYFPDEMADKTIYWLHGVRAQDANKPFFAYFSTGCSHAPHHVADDWAEKYKGKFDQGWDKLREETFARQKELGVMPADAELTPRDDALPAWDDVPANLQAFYARQMEVYAGYSENADHNVGRVIDAIDELGELDNTVMLWIWGDNGAILEGTVTGSFNELTMQNGIPLTDEMQLQLAERYGGLDAWGGDMMVPHYSRGVGVGRQHAVQMGQAGGLASGRHPKPAGRPLAGADHRRRRPALPVLPHHRPRPDDPRHRRHPVPTSRRHRAAADARRTFAESLTNADAPERHTQQYFETIGNRAMYKDGWWLAMKTERIPWVLTPDALKPYAPGVWDPDAGPAELYYLPDDFTQAHDLAAEHPEKVDELKDLFWEEAEQYNVLPLLAALAPSSGWCPASAGSDLRVPRRRCRTSCRGWSRASTTTPTRSPATSSSRRAGPRASSWPRLTTWAGSRSTSRTASSPTPTR